jgi:hypothetical protein
MVHSRMFLLFSSFLNDDISLQSTTKTTKIV